jgi:hypothetical protein
MLLTAALYGTKSDRYFGWTNEASKDGEPILADGAGYYCYLPQWFIYQTSNFEFLDTIGKTYGSSRFTDNVYVIGSGKKASNKYYTGTAVSMIPFFAVAHLYAKNSDYPEDGYSRPYQFMTNVASVAYLLFGLLGVYFLLRRFRIDRFWIVVVCYGIAFGTDVSFFCNIEVPFSHVFSFAVVAWMLVYAKKWSERHSAKNFILLCLLIGWAAIIRPTNVLALAFVPFLFPATFIFVDRIKLLFIRHWKHLAIGLLAFGALLFFQLWNTHDQTGKWALNTYTTESFDNIASPKIFQVLFSWRKGLFIFTPVLLLMIPGWIVLFRKERRLFWGSLFFFALFTYVTASWWCWWYGGGLGMRPYIDMFAILFLPIAFLLQHTKRFFRLLVIGLILLTTWMYQVYEFQMKNNILHYDDMTYEQFSHVFMKQDLRYGWCLHLIYEHLPETHPKQTIVRPFTSLNGPVDPKHYYRLLGDDPGDNPFVTIIPDSTIARNRFGAKVSGNVYLYSGDTNPSFGVMYYNDGELIRENRFFIGQFIDHEATLSPVEIAIYPDEPYGKFDSVRIQFDEGNTFTGVKGLKLEQLIYP